MTGQAKDEIKTLKDGLIVWVEKHNIRITDFAFEMEYTYKHAWSILRGGSPFTSEAFGRFVLAYGTDAACELLALAGVENNQIKQLTPHKGEYSKLATACIQGRGK